MVRIGGIEKVSLLDYPDKVSAVVFTYGCNLKCPFCHNPELVIEKLNRKTEIKEGEFLKYLEERKGKLEAVVITGGEPLLYKDMGMLIKKIKDLGYLVKLDTNGFYPTLLAKIIKEGNIDYIAMDVKYDPSMYISMTGDPNALEKICKSIDIIMNSGLDYEFRTTYVKGIHTTDSSKSISQMIKGAKKYYIQNFRAGKTIDPLYNRSDKSFTNKELQSLLKNAKNSVHNTYIR